MVNILQNILVKDEKGATAVEYAIMVSLIAATIIGSVLVFGTAVTGLFTRLVERLP